MTPFLLVVGLALAQAEPPKPVTPAEKKEFLDILRKLPTRGEFYTGEGVAKAEPHIRVLLALTEKDVDEQAIYPFLALSRGLANRQAAREYAVAHFSAIAHPTLKLFWASVLFGDGHASPEILAFLRRTLDSKEGAATLAAITGLNGFEEFKDKVIRAHDAARPLKVELVKQHEIKAFEAFDEYRGGQDYRNRDFAFGPGRQIHAVRPFKEQGELMTYDQEKGTTRRLRIPQPKGDRPATHFDSSVLSVHPNGDLLCRWQIGGNGDHGFALLKKGAETFEVKRAKDYLANSYVRPGPDDGWYLIRGGPHFTVYALDQNLDLKELGSFAGKGHHTIRIADARFISRDVLHLFWGDVLAPDNNLRMRCADFDIRSKKWLHDRPIDTVDSFVSSANEPTVLQLKDGSLHYLWRVDEGQKPGEPTGLYYQAEADGQTLKLSSSHEYRAIAHQDRIIVCYTRERIPEKVFFRVIHRGKAGPVTQIELPKGREHNLSLDYMVLHAEPDRLWFVNTLTRDRLYELKLIEAKKP